MGTISFQVVEGGQSNATKTFTVSDAHIDRIVAAYQIQANAFVNGTATRAQVLSFWANNLMNNTIRDVLSLEQNTASSGITSIIAT